MDRRMLSQTHTHTHKRGHYVELSGDPIGRPFKRPAMFVPYQRFDLDFPHRTVGLVTDLEWRYVIRL